MGDLITLNKLDKNRIKQTVKNLDTYLGDVTVKAYLIDNNSGSTYFYMSLNELIQHISEIESDMLSLILGTGNFLQVKIDEDQGFAAILSGNIVARDLESEEMIDRLLDSVLEADNDFPGVWAGAVYKFDSNELFLKNDMYGNRPLFGSELGIRSTSQELITAASGESKIDKSSLADYLYHGFTDPEKSYFEEIFRSPNSNQINFDSQQSEKDFSQILDEAIQARVGNNNFAVSISSGVDSVLLAAKTRKYNPTYYSVSFPGADYDERQEVEKIGEELDIEIKFIEVSGKDILDIIDSDIGKCKYPPLSLSVIPHLAVIRKCQEEDISTLLNGVGADEILSNTAKHQLTHISHLMRKGKVLQGINELVKEDRCSIKQYRHILPYSKFLNPLYRRIEVLLNRWIQMKQAKTPGKIIVPHNLKSGFEQEIFQDIAPNAGKSAIAAAPSMNVNVQPVYFDPQIISYVVNEGFEDIYRSEGKEKLLKALQKECRTSMDQNITETNFVEELDQIFSQNDRKRLISELRDSKIFSSGYINTDKIPDDLENSKNREKILRSCLSLLALDRWLESKKSNN